MKKLIIILVVLLGIFFRFYNLSWGAPFYFHPDERNIASSISQLNFPERLNPNFFAYGSFPIYTIYLTGVLFNCILFLKKIPIDIFNVNFENALIIGRFYSAFLSLGVVFLIYKIGVLIKNKTAGIIAIILSSLSIAFIQYSHFATFEIWLTFFSVLLLLFLLKYYKEKKNIFLLLSSFVFGLLVAIKISSLVLVPVLIITILLTNFSNHKTKIRLTIDVLTDLLQVILASFLVFIVTNPFVFIDTSTFLNSMKYESSVALGSVPVFYTGSFYNTLSVLFQYQYIFPFILNPFITLFTLPSFIYFLFLIKRKKSVNLLLILLFFSILFFSQAFLFVKWTRYIIPSIPFLYLIVSLFIVDSLKFIKNNLLKKLLLFFVISICAFYSFSFFYTNYFKTDTRIEASKFAKKNIPRDSRILSEVYDMGIVPFNNTFSNITLFNFYDLDNGSGNEMELKSLLKQSDFIILPSERLVHSRFLNPKKFPKGYNFYKSLFDGSLGFNKIYETPCDIFCRTVYLGDPILNVEETANVFDRPTIFIFERSEKRDDKLIFERSDP